MAFGGVTVDQVGVVRDFPAASMLTGLCANALGWHWADRSRHQMLQDRLVFAVLLDRSGVLLTDTQNAQLSKGDKGWTTSGEPEGRDGATYNAPHRRQRDYHADASARVVLRLVPTDVEPDIDSVAHALDYPGRPLFIGRKPCLPSTVLLAPGRKRWIFAATAHDALESLAVTEEHRAMWPVGEGPESGEGVDRVEDWADLRNWKTGLHSGSRRVVEGWVKPTA